MLWRMVDIAVEMQTDLTLLAYWDGLRGGSSLRSCFCGVLSLFLARITEPAVRAVRLVVAAFAFCPFWIIPQLFISC